MLILTRRYLHDGGEFTISRALLITALVASALLILLISSIPLGVEPQLLFVLASLGLSLLLRPADERARYRVIVLIAISLIATGRYIYWRLTESLGWADPNLHLSMLDYIFSGGLLAAEFYAWTVLFLGYFQTIWPLRRPTRRLPSDHENWPTVDIYIPTYDEPLKVVIPTILAATHVDWPADKLRIYVLDDGCRPEFEAYAKSAGVNYIARESGEGAKAGNINHALLRTNGEFVAIFDCDHVPTLSFLRKTMGWFLTAEKLGLVQTPHVFFTPDPVERNLQVFHRVPNESQLFYGLVQDGNDTWNAAFFCGSCAVLRRSALEEIGGIATDTVTEDAHTSLLLQKKGWSSAYINTPLAAGLATDRLSQHIAQRMRWARGMIQIFRRDNPLFARGLSLAQRLSYFNAMLHFLFSLPRIVFLTAPLAYLFFEAYVIQASAALIAVYALPHIFQAQVANSVMQGRYRHSFWADVYETILSPHLIRPTLTALIAPAKGKFNVTAKGGITPDDEFDWNSSKFVFFLLLLNLIGLIVGFVRLFWLNPEETGTVMINLAWTLYNSLILGAALHVGWEKRQRRDQPRLKRHFEARLQLEDGSTIAATTTDIALSSISLESAKARHLSRGEDVEIELIASGRRDRFGGKVVTLSDVHVGIQLDDMAPAKQADLVYFSHGYDGAWAPWYNACEPSKPLASLLEIIRLGIFGAFRSLFGHSDDPESAQAKRSRQKQLYLFVTALITAFSLTASNTAQAAQNIQGEEVVELSFKDLGEPRPIRLRGGNSEDNIRFALRADKIPVAGQLTLVYSISPLLLDDYKSILVQINGQPVGDIFIDQAPRLQQMEVHFGINPLYVSDHNDLSIKLVPKNPENCEKLDLRSNSAVVLPESRIRLIVKPLELVNELAFFPVPFYDSRDDKPLSLPFFIDPSLRESEPALQAAAIMASWFGAKADYRGADFPVMENSIPDRHSVVFRTADTNYPFLGESATEEPSISIEPLPSNPAIKLLVLSAATPQELLSTVRALASGQIDLTGSLVTVSEPSVQLPKRVPYDAPRWLKDDDKTYFGDLIDKTSLSGRGISPAQIDIYFRVAPDIHIWQQDEFHLSAIYRYTRLKLDPESSLDFSINDEWIKSIHLAPTHLSNGLSSLFRQSAAKYDADVMVEKQTATTLPMDKLSDINKLSFYFDLDIPDEAARTCAPEYIDKMKTEIGAESYFDLTGRDHFTRLPDLGKFATLGFPYTRLADLSQTAVVLPDRPLKEELNIFLDTMGKMGAATGYPVFDVALIFPDAVDAQQEKDLIVIGTDERQSLLRRWESELPIFEDQGGEWRIRGLSWFERAMLWWKGEKDANLAEAQQKISQLNIDYAILTAMESPLKNKRSVVLLFGQTAEKLNLLNRMLMNPQHYAGFHGDLALVAENEVYSFRALPSYYVGDLPWLKKLRWFLATHILALIMLFIFVSLIIAFLLRQLLSDWASSRFRT